MIDKSTQLTTYQRAHEYQMAQDESFKDAMRHCEQLRETEPQPSWLTSMMSQIDAQIPERYTSRPQRVTMRVTSCRCGCKGSDSWHARTMLRSVRDVQQLETPVVRRQHDGMRAITVATATIQTPWGMEAVSLHAWSRGSRVTYDGWYRSSLDASI